MPNIPFQTPEREMLFDIKAPYSVQCIIFKNKKRGGEYMLGLTDGGIIAAYLLVIGSAGLCIIYGWINWGKD